MFSRSSSSPSPIIDSIYSQYTTSSPISHSSPTVAIISRNQVTISASSSSEPSSNTWAGQLAAGGLSCMIVSFALNPMDVVKVRMQTQNELKKAGNDAPILYTGFRQGFARVWREEGLRGLTKGWQPSMLREASYSSLRMGLYQPIRDALAGDEKEIGLGKKIIASMSSGAIGSVLANPTDLVKIRMQCELPTDKPRYKGTVDAFVTIAKQEGIANGLYRGAAATTLRAAFLTAGQLASYDHTKFVLLHRLNYDDGFHVHMISAIIAGLCATTVSSPVDVIKTRYMNSKTAAGGGKPLYTGPLDCLIKTVTHDGIFSLFRGWVPNYSEFPPIENGGRWVNEA